MSSSMIPWARGQNLGHLAIFFLFLFLSNNTLHYSKAFIFGLLVLFMADFHSKASDTWFCIPGGEGGLEVKI